jgi:sulfoxide reductase heme-binding subunit YedZ
MNGFKAHWRWAALNLAGLTVMATLLLQVNAIREFEGTYDPILVSSGKWAIRFLLLSLTMTPLNTLFGWRYAIKLRRSAGLWAFGFAALHFLLNAVEGGQDWLQAPIPDAYAALGVVGLVILTAMALTSTRWAMRQLGKGWKRLHRFVYPAGILILAHGLLEASNSRVVAHDPLAGIETMLYLAILLLLLVVRIPAVRSTIAHLRHKQALSQQV